MADSWVARKMQAIWMIAYPGILRLIGLDLIYDVARCTDTHAILDCHAWIGRILPVNLRHAYNVRSVWTYERLIDAVNGPCNSVSRET